MGRSIGRMSDSALLSIAIIYWWQLNAMAQLKIMSEFRHFIIKWEMSWLNQERLTYSHNAYDARDCATAIECVCIVIIINNNYYLWVKCRLNFSFNCVCACRTVPYDHHRWISTFSTTFLDTSSHFTLKCLHILRLGTLNMINDGIPLIHCMHCVNKTTAFHADVNNSKLLKLQLWRRKMIFNFCVN